MSRRLMVKDSARETSLNQRSRPTPDPLDLLDLDSQFSDTESHASSCHHAASKSEIGMAFTVR